MPNWAEGTLKVRGDREKVRYFLENFVPDLKLCGDGYDLYFDKKSETMMNLYWIEGSTRAFIPFDKIECFYVDVDDETWLVELPIQQAWAISKEQFQDLSRKYDVDFHIFAYENGMKFTQEYEILKGRLTRDSDLKYQDYMWEVPFNTLGG